MSYYDAYADKYQKINGFKIFVKAQNNRKYEGYLSLKPSTRSTYDIAMRDATIDGLITMDEIDKLIPGQIFYRDVQPNELFILQSVNEEPKVSLNDIIVVNFISGDSSIHCGIKCFLSDTFASIEEKLYKRYENHRETNNMFTANGKLVLRFKTLKENGIKDGDIVQLIVQE